MKKLTIRDIAELANTSKSTVSRYLNGVEVKPKTQAAIERVIEETNYYRNTHARMLVMRKTMTIGIVVEDMANKFFTGIFKGIEAFVNQHGYRCVYYSWSQSYSREEDYLSLAPEEQVDGLIFVTFNTRKKSMYEKLRNYTYPVVLIGDTVEDLPVCTVDVDNYQGTEQIVQYLKKNGHQQIAYISGPDHISAVQKRLASFKHEMIGEKNLQIVETDFSNLSGYYAMKKLLNDQPEFTAVICASDEVAIGAMLAIKEQGLRIPEDISLVGFDDIPEANWISPGLTTIRQPFEEIGESAAELVIKQISEEKIDKELYLIQPKLIIRDSVKTIKDVCEKQEII